MINIQEQVMNSDHLYLSIKFEFLANAINIYIKSWWSLIRRRSNTWDFCSGYPWKPTFYGGKHYKGNNKPDKKIDWSTGKILQEK